MARFKLTIDCGNSAFGETDQERADEVARILRDIARLVKEHGRLDGAVADYNGNKVGQFAFTHLSRKRRA